MASSAEKSSNSDTIAIVAGEASGDLLGAGLIAALKEARPALRFAGIGGPRMEAAGMDVWYPAEKLAVRGYVEVLKHYPAIAGIRRRLKRRLLSDPPGLFVGIDAPDFNLGLEAALRSARIPTMHYVSPAIWMWRAHRMRLIKRAVDKMLTVFPFEAPLYARAGVAVEYVGHPLADMLASVPPRARVREQLKLAANAPVIALLPGSRQSELKYMAALFVQTARRIHATLPRAVFLAPLQSRETRDLFEAELYRDSTQPALPLTILFGHAHEALAAADVALVASGTASLEAALLGCPMAITYRMPALSHWILRHKKNYLPFYGLPNILSGEFVIPEIIQQDATPENLSQALINLLNDETVRQRLERRFRELGGTLRQDGAARAAAAVLSMLGGLESR